MPSNVTEMFPTPGEGSKRRSRYQQYTIQSRDRVPPDGHVPARATSDDDTVWRWESPVCNADGEVMRYVRVNARTAEEAVAVASDRIDQDRTLGAAVRLRRAIET